MAIHLYNQPTSPNAAYTRLPYVVTGSTGNPQYQYVMDVYESGSSDRLARFTQRPGPSPDSTAVFDPSRIFQGLVGFDNNWKVTGSIEPVNTLKTFNIELGEQYGTSPSSSVTVYPNQISTTIDIFPGVIDYIENDASWNFNTGSVETNILSNVPLGKDFIWGGGGPALTPENFNLTLGLDDYHTMTALNPIDSIAVTWWSKNNFIGNDLIISSSAFSTIGVGPANLIDLNPSNATYFDTADFVSIVIKFPSPIIGVSYRYAIKGKELDPNCTDEYTRFAFINDYGFWDYYNIYNPVRTETNLERVKARTTQINYSEYDESLFRDYQAKRNEQVYLKSMDRYSIDTDYIDKATGNWLEELLESPEVYLQEGSNFVPIVITNSSYTHNNDQARNKLFQYTIEWEYANARRTRL